MANDKKPIRLRNKYSNDIVFCEDYDDVHHEISQNMDFIRVYTERDPRRTYLANREAFEILPEK